MTTPPIGLGPDTHFVPKLADPFPDRRCTCNVVTALAAAFSDQPRPLCELHDAAEIANRAVDEQRARDEAAIAKAQRIYDELRGEPEPPPCTCPPLTNRLRRMLAGHAIQPCPRHDIEADSSHMSPGDDAALVRAIGLPFAHPYQEGNTE